MTSNLRTVLAGAVTAAVCSAALVGVAAEGDAASSSVRADVPGRVIKPGQVGQARTGMTHAQAMATGELNEDVANPPCEPIRLQPKGPWKRQYVVLVDGRDRIAEIAVFGTRPRTVHGLGVGSTNREVRQAYGARLSPPREVGFGQWGRFVSRGTGADRRWIGFLFGDQMVDDGPLRPRDEVTLVGVRSRVRPSLILDGC